MLIKGMGVIVVLSYPQFPFTPPGVITLNKNYVVIPANQTAFLLGTVGAVGDYLSLLMIVPSSTTPGAVSVQDGGTTNIPIYAGGANAIDDLTPFAAILGMPSHTGGWHVTTGANISVIACGNFT